MSLAAEKFKTPYEALLDVPAHQVAQIINGTLRVMSRPRPRHALASSILTSELVNPFHRGRGGPGGWIILDEPELHLSNGDILVPDLAGWRRERLPRLPNTPYFETIPDWVCEILSPSTARQDRIEKMPIYAQQGVAHSWIIDADLQTLEVYVLQAFLDKKQDWLLWRTYQNQEMVCAPPFEALSFELGGLWFDDAPADDGLRSG